jgi:hypothetical protein
MTTSPRATPRFTLESLTEYFMARYRALCNSDENAGQQALYRLSSLSRHDALDIVYGIFIVEAHTEISSICRAMWAHSYIMQLSKIIISVEPIAKMTFYVHGIWLHTMRTIGEPNDEPIDQWITDLVAVFQREAAAAPIVFAGTSPTISQTGIAVLGSSVAQPADTDMMNYLSS